MVRGVSSAREKQYFFVFHNCVGVDLELPSNSGWGVPPGYRSTFNPVRRFALKTEGKRLFCGENKHPHTHTTLLVRHLPPWYRFFRAFPPGGRCNFSQTYPISPPAGERRGKPVYPPRTARIAAHKLYSSVARHLCVWFRLMCGGS